MIERLRASALLRGVDDDCLEALVRHARQRRLTAGDRLWRAGEQARSLMAVERGLVAVVQGTATGEENLVALFGPGDNLCIAPAIERQSFPADAIAVTREVVVLELAASAVRALMPGRPALALAVNRALLDNARLLRAKIDIVGIGTVPRRLAVLLLQLAERFGARDSEGALVTGVTLTREQLGQLVRARTETVSRLLGRWQRAGWVSDADGGLALRRPEMIERIAGIGGR